VVQRLQETAGNQAVTRMLRARGAAVARDPVAAPAPGVTPTPGPAPSVAPAGPTTSPATAKARQEITDFVAKKYTQTNYVTKNGYGAFDLAYDPSAARLDVTVKLEFQFENAPPTVWLKYVTGSPLGWLNLPDCVWTEPQKEDFKKNMAAEVHRVWSQKNTFTCTYRNADLTDAISPDWEHMEAKANFNIVPVDSGGHFKVKVLALPAADQTRGVVSGADHRTTNKGGAAGEAGADFKATTSEFSSGHTRSQKVPSSFGGPDTDQVRTAHEFGHMLGQDDQYPEGARKAGDTNDSGSKVSSVPADETRIMDGGEVVLPEHLTTVCDALNAATKPVTFTISA
jgi:hypothetical protein